MLSIFGLLTITIYISLPTLTYASVGHGDNHGLGDHHNIDLGTFVGKHSLPPKVIRVTKTVAVKVPVPYPVKVPVKVPYPVPYPKPYPVHIPKIVKVKESVPVYIPGPSKPTHHYQSDASEHYTSQNVHSPQVEAYNGDNKYPSVIKQTEEYYVPQQYAGALANQGYNVAGQTDAQQYSQYSGQPNSENGHNQYEGSSYQQQYAYPQQEQQHQQDYSSSGPAHSNGEYINYQPSGAEHNQQQYDSGNSYGSYEAGHQGGEGYENYGSNNAPSGDYHYEKSTENH